ncbi:MAG: nucleoside deaminase [Thiotrichaceae bacterium]|nr:nucleoside deaminase [Thiotrichaceae bacterium]
MEYSYGSDEYYMNMALQQALIAGDENEIPVGAVVVCNDRVVAKAYNQTEKLNDVTAHAEMLALTSAFNYFGAKYLPDCTLYVTLEPCTMCAGALYWSQIGKVVYGARDDKRGYHLIAGDKKILHPKTELTTGILAEQCGGLVSDFFKKLRKK